MNYRNARLLVVLACGVVAVSFAAIFIRLSNAKPLAISFYRMFFATLALSPIVLLSSKKRKEFGKIKGKTVWLIVASGVALGLHFGAWVTSLDHTSVASSVVLVTTQPLFIVALEFLFFRKKPGRGLSLGMIAAVAGSAMIGLGDMHGGEMQLYGDLLALAGALFAATYLMLGRKVRQKIATFPYIFLVYGISSLFLFALCLQQGVDLITYSGKNWLLFALLALIPTLIGHTSFNWALSEVKASRVGATILGEPIGASILAAIIFDEIPNPLSMAGGLLVLSAIYYIWKKRKPKTLDS